MQACPPLPEDDLNHVLQNVSAWDDLRGAHLFITGGTGFFGAWLLETFFHANRVLGLAARATILSRDPKRFLQKMPHLENCASLNFISGNVRALDASTFAGEKFSHVIHAAAASGANPPLAPLEMFDAIVEGTRRVLDVAVSSGARRLLFVSSGAVYGVQPPEVSYVNEEYCGAPDCLDARAAYGNGKRAAEWMCAAYAEKYPIEIPVARGFAFIGPHLPLDAHFAIGNFLRDAMNGGPIKIHGDGAPLRSYLYAADLAVWLWEILLRGKSARAYNVGSQRAVSILETAQIVAGCFDPKPEILVAQEPEAGVLESRYVPSTQRAESELELRQRVELPEALRRTLNYLMIENA